MTRRQVFFVAIIPLLSVVSVALALSQAHSLDDAMLAAGPAAFALIMAPALLLMAYSRTVAPQLHRALAAYSEGDEATVRGIVAALERSGWRRLVAPNLRYIEALMAFRAGDLAAARRLLDGVLAAPPGVLLWLSSLVLRASARALRSLVASLQGDDAQAEADALALDGDLDGLVEVPALVALARAVRMLRAGQHEPLLRHLDRHRALLLGASPGQARTLARALLRPWVMPGRDAYRSTSDETEPATDPGTAWVTRIAPTLAPLLARRPLESGSATPAPTPTPAAPAPAPARLDVPKPGKPTASRLNRMVVVWMVIVAMFVAVWTFLGPSDGSPPPVARRPAVVQPQKSVLQTPAAPVFMLVGFAALWPFAMRQQRRWLHRSNQADRALYAGDIAACQSFYRELLAQRHVTSRLSAAAKLAALSRRVDDLEDVLRWAEFGRAEAKALDASTRLLLEGSLLAEEALALAALGRPAEARRVIKGLTRELPESMVLPAARFNVELVNLAHDGDLAGARSVARKRPDAMLLPLETEVLAELALATGDADPREPVRALLREAASEPHLAAWLERAAPAVMAEARAIAQA